MSLTVRLVEGLVVALVSYVWASSFDRRFHRRPMASPPWGWAVFSFFLPLVGLIALVVTEIVGNVKGRTASNLPDGNEAQSAAVGRSFGAGSSPPGDTILPH